MKTIRRLYFYAIAFISIEIVLWGMIGLIRSILNQAEISTDASTLAQALSLILVGMPIFLVHWLWAQNVSAKEAEENSASVRAVFLYGILLATLIPVVQNILAFINRTFLTTANLYEYRAILGGYQTASDNLIAVFINLLVAAYFWNVLKNNWRTIQEPENFTEIRRLYRFIWMLYSLLLTLYGTQLVLDFIFSLPQQFLGEAGKEQAVNAIALLIVGTPIWIYFWRLLQDALTDSAERDSYLRLGILYFLTLGSAIVVLSVGGSLLNRIFMQLLGEGDTWSVFIQDVGSTFSVALPLGVVWAYYGKWLNQQFNFDENLTRRASKQRLFYYILALLGLLVSVSGLLTLIFLLADLILGEIYVGDYGFREGLSAALAMLIIGLPVWLRTWIPSQSQATASGDVASHTRRSVIRKSYLYFVLFVAVLGGMASAGILVFTLINSALGGTESELIKTIFNTLASLTVFVVLFLYHFFALQDDSKNKTDDLDEKQMQYQVVVLDHDGKFGEAVKAMFAKRAPHLPVNVINTQSVMPENIKADAVVLAGSVAVNTPASVEVWLRSHTGSKLVVSDEAAGVFWMSDIEQAANGAKSMAEGEEVRPQSNQRNTSVWTYVAYVFAALFACQLIFGLLSFGFAMVSGF